MVDIKDFIKNIDNCLILPDKNQYGNILYISSKEIRREKKLCRILNEKFIQKDICENCDIIFSINMTDLTVNIIKNDI